MKLVTGSPLLFPCARSCLKRCPDDRSGKTHFQSAHLPLKSHQRRDLAGVFESLGVKAAIVRFDKRLKIDRELWQKNKRKPTIEY